MTAHLNDLKGGADQRAAKHYRRDIDGLRALAVLPIVLFHLGVNLIPGGFVGVDIFFVISGYLIGGIVLEQIDDGSYSVIDFYTRRFRRIMPALVVMLVVTTIVMGFVALPSAMEAYGGSLIAAMLSVSNLYFWKTTSYFAPVAESQALLHTWSLAVEEQFYILLPILMGLARRWGRKVMIIVAAVLALASLAVSIAGLEPYPTATFYLLHTRVWELLLGVLAVVTPKVWFERRAWREAAALVGLALIGGSILFYAPVMSFPGLAALPPCLGTALLLCAGSSGSTLVGRLLSFRPLVFVGLISYSLYLWHWPVIVLLKQALLLTYLPKPLKLAALVLSLLLAWVSWRMIERPWRNPQIPARTIFRWTAASAIAVTLLGGAIITLKGGAARFSPEVVRLASLQDKVDSNDFREGRCFISSAYDFAAFDRAGCLGMAADRPNVLIMGDSHAAHLWSGLIDRYPQVNFLQATSSGCRPVLTPDPGGAPRCLEMMRYLFGDYLPKAKLDAVVLSGSWQPTDLGAVATDLDWFRAHGVPVILAGPVVRYDFALPQILATAVRRNDPGLPARKREPGGADLDRRFAELARAKGVAYFSPYKALCHDGQCRTRDAADLPVQFDYGHLTRSGSRIVAEAFPIAAVPGRRR